MDWVLFGAFLTTTLLIVGTPGPSVAYASSQAVKYGPRAAFIAVSGDALGTLLHIAVAVSSFTALISLSAAILPFLQVVGGTFLVYMAYQAINKSNDPTSKQDKRSRKATFWAGFFACVTNPKAIIFFVALFPTFISPDHSILFQSVVYGAIFIILDAASIVGYSLLAMHAVRKTTAKWVNVDLISGLGLFGVGIAMIIKGYKAIPTN